MACSGGSQQVAIGPPPAKQTSGTYAGSLCDYGGVCKCREANDDVGVPTDPTHKRFEFRLGPSAQELWATVHGNVMYKSPEKATECWYVDLPTGEVPIELRASNPSGVSADAVQISDSGVEPVRPGHGCTLSPTTSDRDCVSTGVLPRLVVDTNNIDNPVDALRLLLCHGLIPSRLRRRAAARVCYARNVRTVKAIFMTWTIGSRPLERSPDGAKLHPK